MNTLESEKFLNAGFHRLLVPKEHLPLSQCEPGHYYWGRGRAVGEIAICQESNQGIEFEGLTFTEHGVDELFSEHHWDYPHHYATYRPFVELGRAPTLDTAGRMGWLLDQTVDASELRLSWLKALPRRIRAAHDYRGTIQDETQHLEKLYKTQREGFSYAPTLSFWRIHKEAAAKKNSQAS